MGRNQPKFHDIAMTLIERYIGKIQSDAIRTSLSYNGDFISITIKAQNQQQLDNIYRDLSENNEILIAL